MEPKSRGRDYLAKTKKAMVGAKITAKINSRAAAPHPASLDRSRMERMPVITNAPTAKPKLTGRANAITRGVGQKVGLRAKMEQMPAITNTTEQKKATVALDRSKMERMPVITNVGTAKPKRRVTPSHGVGQRVGRSIARAKMTKIVPKPTRRTAKARGLLDNWR